MTHSDSLVDAVAKIIREAHGEKTDRELAEATIAAVRRLDAAGTAPEAEHPAPWRWAWERGCSSYTQLLDASGEPVIVARETDDAGRHALELIRLAPEMEAALSDLRDVLDAHKTGAGSAAMHARQTETERRVGVILAALDAARAVKP